MSSEKTEKPTDKKLRDAAKKGQVFKARDLGVAMMLLCAALYLTWALSFASLGDAYRSVIEGGFTMPIRDYMVVLGLAFFKMSLPLIALCVLVSALPALLLSKFALATEAIKIDFTKLNPVQGFKQLFSMRTVKEAIKALLYLSAGVVAIIVFWKNNQSLVFSMLQGSLADMIVVLPKLFMSMVILFAGCAVLVFVLDALAEFFLYIKNLKMDKHEVKQEYKEQEGHPEVKSRRREAHMEILNEQIKNDVKQSNFILANPTHIAIGIYFNPAISMVPYISVLECNQRARAVIAYAEKCGIPVFRDIPLARRLYKISNRYTFMPIEEIEGVYRILEWLMAAEQSAAMNSE
jgi:type III secretion protein U